jgi:tetratricopeptide (TPR) repeat protein
MTDDPAAAGADQQAIADEQADVAIVINIVRDGVRNAAFGETVGAAERKLRQPLQRCTEYRALRDVLTSLQRDLSAFLTTVETAHRELDRREQMRADAQRFGAVWWQQRERSIGEQRTPEQRTAAWVDVFAEALLDDRFDVCARLASPAYPQLPADALLVRRAQAGAQALGEGRWGAAAPLLRMLADGPWGALLAPARRVSIELLLARTLLPIAAERRGIRRRLAAAKDWPGVTDAQRALLAVGAGECSLAEGDLDAAAATFAQAAELNPQAHAPHVGLGLVAERRATWFVALDQFDQAVERVPDGSSLARMRAPVSGNLYWRLAIKLAGGRKSLEAPDPGVPAERRRAALEAIGTALSLGIGGHGEFPERKIRIYQADLLHSLDRDQEAAAAYYDAAQHLQVPTDDAVARTYLEKACELGPGVPVHHWSLAETLRRLAYAKDGKADPALLGQAITRWEAGTAIGSPGREEAWAYVTLALAKMDQRVPTTRSAFWEVAALCERAVLLDGSYVLGWAALAHAHNRIGNPRTALAAANHALAEDSSDPIALENRTLALALLEQNDQAALAVRSLADGSTSLWVRLFVRIVARQAEAALSLLSEAPPGDEGLLRIYRSMCNRALGREADEIEDLRWIWAHRDDDPAIASSAGWAAYRLGHYDAAEECYWRILDPRDQSVLDQDAACDLGQVFLERGDEDRDDLSRGESLLRAGIGQHPPALLTMLGEVELPQLRQRLADKPHAARAVAIVDEVLILLRKRHAALTDAAVTAETEMREVLGLGPAAWPVGLVMESTGPDAGEQAAGAGGWRPARRQAAQAALGWLASTAKAWREAAEAYVALGQEGLPDDAADGFIRAAAALRAEADDAARSGHPADARVQYAWLAEQVAAHAPGQRELRSGLLCRAAMAGVAGADLDGARRDFDAAATAMAGRVQDWKAGTAGDGLRELARIFTSSVPAFWTQADGLTSVKADDGLTGPGRALVDALLAGLSLDDAYRTRRSDVDSSATFPLTNIVVLSLGPGLIPADTTGSWQLLDTALPRLHDQIEHEYGIPVPGIRIVPGQALAPTGFEILLYGSVVRRGEIPAAGSPPGQPPPLDEAVAALRDILVGNLGRLLGPDDLVNWAAPDDGAGPEALGDIETRLRVQRVLRLLLREGVPVTNRRAVLGAIAAAVTSGADTLTALGAARRALAPVLTGTGPRLEQLPAALESAVAQCVRTEDPAGRPVWQSPRADAAKLAGQLRDYFSSLPAGAAVVVDAPEVRFFITRLLSGVPCRVLAKAELEAAGRLEDVDASAISERAR